MQLRTFIPGLICFGCLSISGVINSQTTNVDHWESVVYANDLWRYYVGLTSGPDAGWQDPGFDDSSWPQGQGGFGYADGDDVTLIQVPPYPLSVFTRIEFEIEDTSQIAMALLNMDFDDGFVAWINGVEVARSNLGTPGDHPAYDTPAVDHEAIMLSGLDPHAFLLSKPKLMDFLINGVNVLAVQVNNSGISSSDLSCLSWLSLGMKTAAIAYNPVPDWFDDPYLGFDKSLLPLVIIETNGVTIKSEDKVMVDFGIIDNGPDVYNYLTDEWNGYSGIAGIEFRGSSSMMFPKKNYGFETRKIDGSDTAVSMLGMPAESDWVLHGPYSDKSLIRNFLAYDLGRAMGHYAPRTRFCEMFIDGQYQGLYVMVEKIKRDTNRVAIAKLDTADLEGHDLTGGYIVKIDRSADGSYTDGWRSPYAGTGTEGSHVFFAYHYPKWEEILPKQKEYIRQKINSFEHSLKGDQYRDPYIGYRSFIDVISFIDYFLLVELGKNTDGYRLSTFLHKDRDDRDPRIHMGPVWDYDLAFGNVDYYDAYLTYGWNYMVPTDGWGTPFWWSRLISDPFFANNLNCRWRKLRRDVLSNESLMLMIDSYLDEIGPATDRNFNQWPIHGVYVWPNKYVGITYEEDIAYMKDWILDRAAWMDSNIPGAECTVTNGDDVENSAFFMMAKPNPAIAQITIEIQNPLQLKLVMEVTNLTGQQVYAGNLGNDPYLLETIKLQPGLYIVKVNAGVEMKTIKIVLQ